MADVRGNIAQPTDELGQLSDPGSVFKNPAQAEFVRTLIKSLTDAFRGFVSRDKATPYFYLSSPNGTGWKITVSDAGVLTVEPARK